MTIKRSFASCVAAGLLLVLMPAATLVAQQSPQAQKEPRIGYVYPAGGQRGTTFQVTLGGQYLGKAHGLVVSGGGVDAKVLDQTKPLSQGEYKKLQEQLKELQKRKAAAQRETKRRRRDAKEASTGGAWTAADERRVADIRKQLSMYLGKKPATPAICETVTLEVTMAAEAEPGQRELRLKTASGLTNPLVFWVGELQEFGARAAKPQGISKLSDREVQKIAPTDEIEITLPAVVNGQITPGEVDRFRFKARKGQRLVIATQARQLIPYLPDAVPGWFQATLTLYDAEGRELAYDDDFRFDPDPVLYYVIPADGKYAIEIKDSIYRGREDFVYRISVGKLPFVTGLFPLGGPAGATTSVQLRGWNLPAKTLTVADRHEEAGVYPLTLNEKAGPSGCALLAVNTLPECLEQEPNNKPDQAQSVTLPVIANGRIEGPDDCDVFRFEGHAGAKIVAEVYARRLNSPLDSVLTLTDASGTQVTMNDDHEDKGAGLTTHHADSLLRATLLRDGTYCLHLRDVQRNGGPDYAYRLRISGPRPDFALRVVPSSINVRAGSTVSVMVYALRTDGFAGAIDLALKNAPAGISLGGARVPAGQNEVPITLTADRDSQSALVPLQIEGRALIDGRQVAHAAMPAEDMMQAFAYRHLVPAQSLLMDVSGSVASKRRRLSAEAGLSILGDMPVTIPAGGTARLQVAIPSNRDSHEVEFKLSEAPEGISVESVAASSRGVEILLHSDAEQARPGMEGNLIVTASEKKSKSGKNKSLNKPRTTGMETLPAIPFKIVKPSKTR